MIRRRNLDVDVIADLDLGRASDNHFGYGNRYFVDVAYTGAQGVSGVGNAWDSPFALLSDAFNVMGKGDIVYVAPGGITENLSTPLNAIAPFCSLIGVRPGALGVGAWWQGASSSTDNLIVRARGWRISGMEFDGQATAAAIALRRTAGDTTERADYTQIDNCLFTSGQAGIEFQGGGNYCNIYNNIFTLLEGSGAGKGAVVVTDITYVAPAFMHVYRNRFIENVQHLAFGGDSLGVNAAIIEANLFQLAGATTCTLILDTRSGGNGFSQIIGNYFGTTKSDLGNDASTLIFTDAGDEGMGNWCLDGALDAEIGH